MGGSFFRNNQDYTMKFGLIPKNSTSREDVIWIDSGEAGAIVHPLHAWEEVTEYQNGEVQSIIKLWTPFCKNLDLDLEKSNEFHMMEFTIDPHYKTVLQEVIDTTINSEFATMPPKPSHLDLLLSLVSSHAQLSDDGEKFETNTAKTCTSKLSVHDNFGFTAIFGNEGHFIGYAKWDMVSRSLHSTVCYQNGEICDELMIVRARQESVEKGEDDIIYVGSYMYNEEEDQSYFVLFYGETNQQVCRLKMPSRVPYGFHGEFIPGEQFESHFQYHEALDKGFTAHCPIKWLRFFIRDYILGNPYCQNSSIEHSREVKTRQNLLTFQHIHGTKRGL